MLTAGEYFIYATLLRWLLRVLHTPLLFFSHLGRVDPSQVKQKGESERTFSGSDGVYGEARDVKYIV